MVAVCLACTAPPGRDGSAVSQSQAERRAPKLDHLTPARDSVGDAPSEFSWTPVEGADHYAIGVWSEVDVMVWRRDDVPGARVTLPPEMRFEPGTYFWSVTALRGAVPLADSGRSAFVVRADR